MRKVILSISAIIIMSVFCCAESCSRIGAKDKKYTPQSDCTYKTETRTCCDNGEWSEWDKECSCEDYKFFDKSTSTCVYKYDSYVNTKDMGIGYSDQYISKCYTARDNWKSRNFFNCDVILDVDRSAFVGKSGHYALCAQYDNGKRSRKICLLAYCHYGFSQNGYNYNIFSYEIHTCNYTTKYANALGLK